MGHPTPKHKLLSEAELKSFEQKMIIEKGAHFIPFLEEISGVSYSALWIKFNTGRVEISLRDNVMRYFALRDREIEIASLNKRIAELTNDNR